MQPIDHDVPFISNTPEDKQCLQAAYGMIRQYFEPNLDITWDDWAEITGYLPGKGTWSMAGLMWFKDNGYEVIHIAGFDYGRMAEEGATYLVEAYGDEIAAWKLKYMDLKVEQARALRFKETGIWIKREATLADIHAFLHDGYLIKCLVNLNVLNDKPGYVGHAVVVKGYTDKEIIIHDPGLPAVPNRHVPIEKFLRAWETEGPNSEKLDAIRKIHAKTHIWPKLRWPVFKKAKPREPIAA